MAGNDTAALVVALSAQLTKFEKDMKSAGDVADRTASGIEDRFSRINPFAGTFLGNFASNLVSKGIGAAEDAIKNLVNRFEELEYTAKYTETAIQSVYGLQSAFQKSKSSADDLNKSLMTIALQLNQIQRGNTDNSLAKLFNANPQAMKDVKVDALDAAGALQKVADIMQTLKPIERLDVAKTLGLPDSAVQALERGGTALRDISDAAAKAAPDIEKIANQAKALLEVFTALGTALKNELISEALDMIKTDISDLIQLTTIFLSLFKGGPLEEFTNRALSSLQSVQDRLNKVKSDASPVTHVTVTKGSPKYAGKDPFGLGTQNGADQSSFDRTIETITRHTQAVNADTLAVDKSNAAREQLRAEFSALNSLRKDDIGVTEQQVATYEKLRATMTAEQALEQAHINLAPSMKAAFLQASEGAGQAVAKYDAARERINQLNNASQQIGSALSTAFADAVVEGKSLNDVMSSLLKTLEKAAINSIFSSIFNPIGGNALSSFASLISGARANGGPVSAGQAYIVGERRPEVFVPNQNGMIIPQVPTSSGGGGSSTTIQYTIDARGADASAVERIKRVLDQHGKAISGQARSLQSAQRYQNTGVY